MWIFKGDFNFVGDLDSIYYGNIWLNNITFCKFNHIMFFLEKKHFFLKLKPPSYVFDARKCNIYKKPMRIFIDLFFFCQNGDKKVIYCVKYEKPLIN